MSTNIDTLKKRIRQAIAKAVAEGKTPAGLAREIGLHRNALYGCDDPDWDPKSSTLEKLERHLL